MRYFLLLFAWVLSTALFAQRSITVDGDPSDWIGTPSTTVHGFVYSKGEWIYTGAANDERTDYNGTQSSSDNDITEVRFGQDGTFLYILIKMRDITNIDYPHACLVFTNGSSNQSFIGDDSKTDNTNGGASTPLGNSVQYGRLVDLHASSTQSAVIEMYDGGVWYAPPSGNSAIAISTANDVIEARIALDDLGLSSNSSSNVSLMTAPNRVGWNNDVDATAWANEGQTNGVDVMTPGSAADNAWFRDLDNGDVGYYATISFSDASLPVTLSSFTSQIENQRVILTWITESEVNVLGYEILRATDENGPYQTIASYRSHPELRAKGSSSSQTVYRFNDGTILNGNTYWYKLISHDLDGSQQQFGPISVVLGNNSDVNPISDNIPQQFELKQNFPNPFNNSTTIEFNIPQLKDGAVHVQLKIFDITGKLVQTLLDQRLEAGSYHIIWNGKNFNGHLMPTGVYIYQLSTDQFVFSRKMFLIQ